MPLNQSGPPLVGPHYTTKEVAQLLGLAVSSIQLMVDRGELDAWKTPGGHRRISEASVRRWIETQGSSAPALQPTQLHEPEPTEPRHPTPTAMACARVLIIEDSVHYQKLASMLIRQRLPGTEVLVADDGIAGLAMAGKWEPDVLIVDILLPGIDGATLIHSLRTHQQFEHTRLIIMTSLDELQLAAYARVIEDVPVVHKLKLVKDLPPLLLASLSHRLRDTTA